MTFFLLAVMLQSTWPSQYTKNIPQNYFWAIHLVRTYLMTDFSVPLPLYAPVHIFDDLPFIPPVVYVLNGLRYFSTKKQITTFQYHIHLNKNTRKKIL